MGPLPIEDLITAFARLPGIGRKTAQRLAFYVVKQPREEADALARAIVEAKDNIHFCAVCYNFTERGNEECEICRNSGRDKGLICVVEEASDVLTLERDPLWSGVYHVLGGVLSPLDNVNPDDLRIAELMERVQQSEIREVILALNASAEGDTTAEYIRRELAPLVSVTQPARGLPMGADLDLADKVTLAHALAGRRTL